MIYISNILVVPKFSSEGDFINKPAVISIAE